MGFLAVAPVCLCGDETGVGSGVTVGVVIGVVVGVGLGSHLHPFEGVNTDFLGRTTLLNFG